jgi:hypothetical protein
MNPGAGFLLLGLVVLAGAGRARESIWEPQPSLPVGVAGFVAAEFGGKLHVAGGTAWSDGQKFTLDRRWSWRPGDPAWVQEAPLPRAFAYGASGRFAADWVLAGGATGSATRAEVIRIAAAGGGSTVGALTRPAAYCGSVAVGSRLFVLGGTENIDDLKQLRATFEAFDLSTGRAELLPDYPGGPALHPRLAAIDGGILVFPGGSVVAATGAVINGSAVWHYEFATRRWRPRTSFPFAVRGLAVCALDPGHILLAGGTRADRNGQSVMTSEAFVYAVTADAFRPLPPLPYAAALMEAVRSGDWIYVLGGEDQARHRAQAVFRAPLASLLEAAR